MTICVIPTTHTCVQRPAVKLKGEKTMKAEGRKTVKQVVVGRTHCRGRWYYWQVARSVLMSLARALELLVRIYEALKKLGL